MTELPEEPMPPLRLVPPDVDVVEPITDTEPMKSPEALLEAAGDTHVYRELSQDKPLSVAVVLRPTTASEYMQMVRESNYAAGLVPRDYRGVSANLGALRMMARKSLGELAHVCNHIASAPDSSNRDRIAAINVLREIGVPKQIEVKTWDGDWNQFSLDELERITQGEHPEDILAQQAQRRMAASQEAEADEYVQEVEEAAP
jgi:hypothetical protein